MNPNIRIYFFSKLPSTVHIFAIFLKLGLTCFGGPIAHLGYFRNEFVRHRKWISDSHYGDLVTLCQFLPGPTSSQVGFLIGYLRGGLFGAIAAWIGFTAPSAVLMTLLAYGYIIFTAGPATSLIHGLKLVAVVVVAQALMGMARTLTPDRTRIMIAVFSAGIVLAFDHRLLHIAVIFIGAVFGLMFCRNLNTDISGTLRVPIGKFFGAMCLTLFLALLIILPFMARSDTLFSMSDMFYRSGAFVFGGGHVVLPLLENEFVTNNLVDRDQFLAGYGFSQAMPGPLFTFAAYLGTLAKNGPGGYLGSLNAIISIFLPGFLIVMGVAPFWTELRRKQEARVAMAGANAAVVGILGAALYHPILTSSLLNLFDLILLVFSFISLIYLRIPILVITILLPLLTIIGYAFGLNLT